MATHFKTVGPLSHDHTGDPGGSAFMGEINPYSYKVVAVTPTVITLAGIFLIKNYPEVSPSSDAACPFEKTLTVSLQFKWLYFFYTGTLVL